MNILYCITFLHFGAGRALLDLAKEAVSRGHHVVIAATDKIDSYASQLSLIEEAKNAGIQIIICQDLFTRRFNNVSKSARQLQMLMLKQPINLIHSHAAVPGFAAELAAQAAYGCRIPHISTVHAWSPDKVDWMRLQDRIFLNQVECVHAVSDDVAEFLIREGVVPEKIVRIYNGCDFSRIDRLLTEPKVTGLSIGKKRRIGVVANLVKRKGLNYLIDAFILIPSEIRDNLEVFIIGDGPERNSLQEKVSLLGLSQSIHFLGQLNNPYPLMVDWDLLVLPSLSEGLPVSLVEAMYLKVPVLATDVQGNREIVANGRGWSVPPQNPVALAKMITDIFKEPGNLKKNVERAYNWVTMQFNQKKCFDELFDLVSARHLTY